MQGLWWLVTWWLLFAAAASCSRLTGFVEVCSECIALLKEQNVKRHCCWSSRRNEVLCLLDVGSVVGKGLVQHANMALLPMEWFGRDFWKLRKSMRRESDCRGSAQPLAELWGQQYDCCLEFKCFCFVFFNSSDFIHFSLRAGVR